MGRKIVLAVCVLMICLAPVEAQAGAAAGWSDPIFTTQTTLAHPAIDAAGQQMVAVDWSSNGSADMAKNLLLYNFTGTTWGEPQVLAQNAFYSSSLFQDPPRDTFPVISDDGETVAYLGYDAAGETYRLYLIDKTSGAWGAPYPLPDWTNCVDNDLDLSADGDTLAFSNCPAMFSTMRVYVSRRVAGVWQEPVVVSGDSTYEGGAQPALSADGRGLVYQESSRIKFTQRLADDSWSEPLDLTHCYFSGGAYYMYLPEISPDGNAIFFWRYVLTPGESGSVVSGKDLYSLRRYGGTWGRPAKISGESIVPDLSTDSRPAVDRTGTRVIFSRSLWGDPYTGSRLELTEYRDEHWTTPVTLTVEYQAEYPRLTPDGRLVVFDHSTYAAGGVAALVGSDDPPGFNARAVSGQISPAGGSLAAEDDPVTTYFAAGTFGQSAQVTYTVLDAPDLPPAAGLARLGDGFDLSAVNVATGLPAEADPAYPFTVQVDTALRRFPGLVDSLKLYAWEPATCLWAPLERTTGAQPPIVSSGPTTWRCSH